MYAIYQNGRSRSSIRVTTATVLHRSHTGPHQRTTIAIVGIVVCASSVKLANYEFCWSQVCSGLTTDLVFHILFFCVDNFAHYFVDSPSLIISRCYLRRTSIGMQLECTKPLLYIHQYAYLPV